MLGQLVWFQLHQQLQQSVIACILLSAGANRGALLSWEGRGAAQCCCHMDVFVGGWPHSLAREGLCMHWAFAVLSELQLVELTPPPAPLLDILCKLEV